MNVALFLGGALLFVVGVGNRLWPGRTFEIRHWPVRAPDVPAEQVGFTVWRGLGAVLVVLGLLTMAVALR